MGTEFQAKTPFLEAVMQSVALKNKAMPGYLMNTSALVASIVANNVVKTKSNGNGDPFYKFKTHTGTRAFKEIDTAQMVMTEDAVSRYSIAAGTKKVYKEVRNIVKGYFEGNAEFGYAQTFTKNQFDDNEDIPGGSLDLFKSDQDKHEKGMMNDIFLQVMGRGKSQTVDSNGVSATVIGADGKVVPGFVGLNYAIGESKYKNITVAQYEWWKSLNQNLNGTTNLFGISNPNTDMNTIAKCVQFPTAEYQVPHLWNVLSSIFTQLKGIAQNLGAKSNYVCVVNPLVYQHLILPIATNLRNVIAKSGGDVMGLIAKNGDSIKLDSFVLENMLNFNGLTFLVEHARINNTYLLPNNKMYILNLADISLTASKNGNFETSGLEKIQPLWRTLETSTAGRLRLDVGNRLLHSILTLNSGVVTELGEIGGYMYETQDS